MATASVEGGHIYPINVTCVPCVLSCYVSVVCVMLSWQPAQVCCALWILSLFYASLAFKKHRSSDVHCQGMHFSKK